MCDYSLQNVKSRPAAVGDKLITCNFNTGTRGFASQSQTQTGLTNSSPDAVCVLPGTELAFDAPVKVYGLNSEHATAIFRQINLENKHAHHDALEFPDGKVILLTFLIEGQHATVLQLPAPPRSAKEAQAQKRVEFAG